MSAKVVCPWCRYSWWGMAALARHVSKRHVPCRFCDRAYIRVDQHERRVHPFEYAAVYGPRIVLDPLEGPRCRIDMRLAWFPSMPADGSPAWWQA